MRSKAGLLMAALAMTAAMPGLPVLEVRRNREDDPLWPMKPDPDNRGRRAEKDAIALAKAEAKRQRRAAKRLAEVSAGDTADKRHNAKVSGPEAALSPEGRARLPGCAPAHNGE